MPLAALIFDVDGTLAETEEIHRLAFDETFAEAGLPWRWDADLYRVLLRTTGGKERIRRFLDLRGVAPESVSDARIAELHARKTALYGARIAEGRVALRPGVAALLAAARDRGLRLAIATTTSRPNIEILLDVVFGAAGATMFETMVCGEDVVMKKPAPDAYLEALRRLALPAAACLAFEDSANGLASARAAGLATIVTPSLYTGDESFEGAAAILPDLAAFDLAAWA
jgi:HAD superfamily hydrolase (TIGR01509 family)